MATEKRLIDANALDEKLDGLMTRYASQGRKEAAEDYNFVRTVLLAAPTVEAVEVVRCGVCRHRHTRANCQGRNPLWFCASGERNGVTFATDISVGDKLAPTAGKLSAVLEQRWIPVTERLPEGECIACGYQNEMIIGYVGDSEYSSTGYAAENDGEHLDDVTHWMPLPEPPKGD